MTAWRRALALLGRWRREPAEAGRLVPELVARMDALGVAPLGSSLSAFHLAAGTCGGCGIEVRGVQQMLGALGRLGLRFTDTPRQADILLVTGAITHAMQDAVLEAWDAMPEPRWLVSVGDCAVDGGLFRGGYAVRGGVGDVLPVDLAVRGCPPSPDRIMEALRALVQANQTAGSTAARFS